MAQQTPLPHDMDDLLNDLVEDELILDKELEFALGKIDSIKQQLQKTTSQEELDALQEQLTQVYERYMTMLALVEQNAEDLYEKMDLEKVRVDLSSVKK